MRSAAPASECRKEGGGRAHYRGRALPTSPREFVIVTRLFAPEKKFAFKKTGMKNDHGEEECLEGWRVAVSSGVHARFLSPLTAWSLLPLKILPCFGERPPAQEAVPRVEWEISVSWQSAQATQIFARFQLVRIGGEIGLFPEDP